MSYPAEAGGGAGDHDPAEQLLAAPSEPEPAEVDAGSSSWWPRPRPERELLLEAGDRHDELAMIDAAELLLDPAAGGRSRWLWTPPSCWTAPR